MSMRLPTPLSIEEESRARKRVLWLSTVAFTVLFAVWLMLGVLGLHIKTDARLMLGDSAQGLSPQQIKAECESRFEWLLAISILSGALFRLNFGVWADKHGGRDMMVLLLLGVSIPTFWLAYAQNYTELLICSFLFGLAGNSFSIGVSWNSAWFPEKTKGTALGIFGAGNVGASGVKLLAVLVPGLFVMAMPVSWIPGGWRLIPLLYSAILVGMAILIMIKAPKVDRKPSQGRSTWEMLTPLKYLRVWRLSLYYVVVFGAYVALSAWLPTYYVNTYGLSIRDAALLTVLFIFPASLLRPLGGWLSDQYGPRLITYLSFVVMIVATAPLCLPERWLSVSAEGCALLMFFVGVGMGVGKASVFKYIPNYFQKDVGAVGGLVGLLGALGGFLLPKAFGWMGRTTGIPQASFLTLLVLTVGCLVWLHWTVRGIKLAEEIAKLPRPLDLSPIRAGA